MKPFFAERESKSLTSRKGLAVGKVGTFAGAVLGTASMAPAYTLATSLGLMVDVAGVKTPAIILLGFVPMFLVAWAYRELNDDFPDCGSTFTWVTRAFGPYVGWMAGWGMVIASIIVLANLASIVAEFFYLLCGEVLNSPEISGLAANTPLNILTVVVVVSGATWVCTQGVTTSQNLQFVLVGFQLLCLVAFAALALTKAGSLGGARISFDWSWLDPFAGLGLGAAVVGLTGSVFAFWGWDTPLTLGEEAKDPQRSPGRAGLLCILTVLPTYLIVAVAAMMFAGVGTEGLGLGNPDNSGNVLATLGTPVLGNFGGPLLFLAILISAASALQTTILTAARATLAMGVYEARPARFAKVDPRTFVPRNAAVFAGVVTVVFYTFVTLLSRSTLIDTISALGIMICWYLGVTALACTWHFRRSLFDSLRNFAFRLVCPVFGGGMLFLVLIISARDTLSPSYGSGADLFGVGLVFYLAFGVLGFGAVLMLAARVARPGFFLGETLNADSKPWNDEDPAEALATARAGDVAPDQRPA